MPSKLYRKKPSVIEALRWTGDNIDDITTFVPDHYLVTVLPNRPLEITTPHGDAVVAVGEWIIRRDANDYYPCRNSVFEDTYEEVK